MPPKQHTDPSLNQDRHPNRRGTAPFAKKNGLKGWGTLEDEEHLLGDEVLKGSKPPLVDKKDPGYVPPEEEEEFAEEDEELKKQIETGDLHPEIRKVGTI